MKEFCRRLVSCSMGCRLLSTKPGGWGVAHLDGEERALKAALVDGQTLLDERVEVRALTRQQHPAFEGEGAPWALEQEIAVRKVLAESW